MAKTSYLVVEFLSAGGANCPEFGINTMNSKLSLDGQSMLQAFASQLAWSSDDAVSILVERPLDVNERVQQIAVGRGQFTQSLIKAAESHDYVFLIAPELNRIAERCCRALDEQTHKLISQFGMDNVGIGQTPYV